MSRVVLSIGSNLGDRMARLQAAVDALGDRVVAVSPVFQSDPWGGVEQGPFLNAVIVAEDPSLDGADWLDFAQRLEREADRVRGQKWGPRTLDVDLITVHNEANPDSPEEFSRSDGLTLPHPLAHLRAFVLIPWLAVDPDAWLTVADVRRTAVHLLDQIDAAERAGVHRFDAELHGPDQKA